MHCDQCGKENRPGSKFCRSCGNSLLENGTLSSSSSSRKNKGSSIIWKSPIVLIIVTIIVLAGLIFGGIKAYAFYQVESKINAAKKLQTSGDYKGSIDALAEWENKTFTNSQKTRIDGIKADSQKFITFKTAYDNAIALENGTSTATTSVSVSLQNALTSLQSIDSSYPDYKDVQVQMTKIQNELVTALQNETAASKAEAERNKAAAAAAQAARSRAEANAQRAQSEASSAAATARGAEVAKSFTNQLLSAYNNLRNGDSYYSQAMGYHNAGSDASALVIFAKANAVYSSVSDAASGLNSTFSGLPQSYVDAANNLASAAYYNIKATNSVIDGMSGNSTASQTNYYSNLGDQYRNAVGSFLRNLGN